MIETFKMSYWLNAQFKFNEIKYYYMLHLLFHRTYEYVLEKQLCSKHI